MKFNKLFLVSLVILTVLTLGVVSASDDISDNNLTESLEDDVNFDSFNEDVELSTDDAKDVVSEKESVNWYLEYAPYENEVIVSGGDDEISISINDEVSANIELRIDGDIKDSRSVSGGYVSFFLNNLDLTYGEHIWNVTYLENDYYCQSSFSGKFQWNYIYVDIPDEVDSSIEVKIDPEASGNITLFIDGVEYYNDLVEDTEYIFLSDLTFGRHTYNFTYSGDDKFMKFSKSGVFNYTYEFSADIDYVDEILEYGKDIIVDVSLPTDVEGNIIINVNGKTFTQRAFEYNNIKLQNVLLGENIVTLTYKDDNYPTRTKKLSFRTYLMINGPEESVVYGNPAVYSLILPQNATGRLIVYSSEWDGDELKNTTLKTANVQNGKAICEISGLDLGYYYLYASYEGTDYDVKEYGEGFKVIPKVSYMNKIWINSTDENLKIEFPENITADLKFSLYKYNEPDETYLKNLYSGKIKGSKIISLGKLDSAGDYYVQMEYDDGNFSTTQDYWFTCLETSPNTTVDMVFENEKSYLTDLSFKKFKVPEAADGNILVLVNGKVYDNVSVSDNFEILSDLTVGTYDIELRYVDDSYYKSSSVKGKLYVTYFYIPDEVVYGIDIDVPNDSTGYVSLIIDGESYYVGYCSDTWYLNLNDISIGMHSYEISYSGDQKYIKETKTGIFNKTYHLAAYPNFMVDLNDVDDEYDDIDDGEDVDELKDDKFIYGQVDFSIEIPKDGTGYATVIVDGKNSQIIKDFVLLDHSDCLSANFKLPDVDVGKHTLTVSYFDSKYPLKIIECNFTVVDKYKIDYPSYSISYNQSVDNEISLILPQNAKGNLVVTIEGKENIIKLVNGHASFNLANLTPGYYSISANYDGEDYDVEAVELAGFEDDEKFKVEPKVITKEVFVIGENEEITVEVPKSISGEFKVTFERDIENVGGKDALYLPFGGDRTIKIIDGKATLPISNMLLGFYYVNFEYVGDADIPSVDTSFSIRPNRTIPEVIYPNEDAFIKLELPKDAKGQLMVKINGKNLTGSVVDGIVSVKLENLSGGNNGYVFDYIDDKYGNYSAYGSILVLNGGTNIKISNPSDSIIEVELNDDATGKIVLSINGQNYEKTLNKGKATFTVPKLSSDNQSVILAYSGDKKYGSFTHYDEIPVKKDAKIIAGDLSMIYSDGSKYSVTVYGADGKLVSGVVVTFKINNKKIGTAKTDKNGVASIKITQVPKTYKITSEALGVSVTKKLTVKHILTLKKVKVKKSAKKLVLTAALKKVKGKYLKGKVIKFKFNGKTYKAKTNKKGVAKVTIKKSVLKKLKVGKKVKYQATYLKDTLKLSVKVKK